MDICQILNGKKNNNDDDKNNNNYDNKFQ